MIAAADERSHLADQSSNWVEAWLFDFVQADTSIAASIEFLLWPQHGRVAFHTSVVRPSEGLVSLVELDASAPKPPSLEVRAPGLWTDIGIQTPLDHVTVDLEAFAVELDNPNDVFSGGYGIRTPLGGELEWETAGVVVPGAAASSYEVPCIVHGELLIAEQIIEIDGWGWRSHRWGAPARQDRTPLRGRTASGEWFRDTSEDRALTMRMVGAAPVPDPTLDAQLHQYLAKAENGDTAWVRRSA